MVKLYQLMYGINSIQTMQINIYTRWGEKVFQTSDPNDSWDASTSLSTGSLTTGGTYRNKQSDDAIFVYQLNLVLKNKRQISIKGNISLIK